MLALAGALGETRVHLVGHDWGGIIAWQAARRRPDVVRDLCVMNALHPTAFARYARAHPKQLLKSSYMFFFQAPRLPEWLLTRRGARAVVSAFRRAARRKDAFTDADLEVYRTAFLRPGAARCTLAYYRQAVRRGTRLLPDGPVEAPVLALWGTGDPVVEQDCNRDLARWAPHSTFVPIDDCGHWTQQEQPGRVNEQLIAWLVGAASTRGSIP